MSFIQVKLAQIALHAFAIDVSLIRSHVEAFMHPAHFQKDVSYFVASTIFIVSISESHPQYVVTSLVTVSISTRLELAITMF